MTRAKKKNFEGWQDRPLWGGCHEWGGTIAVHRGGYEHPMVRLNGKTVQVRRHIWECLSGPIQKGYLVKNTCGNTKCVWIGHMLLTKSTRGLPRIPGDKFLTPEGYVMVVQQKGDAKLEHRIVMENYLHRKLLPGENIHHKNGVRDDNIMSNLELWVTLQPLGQRPEDLVSYAREILSRYEVMVSNGL